MSARVCRLIAFVGAFTLVVDADEIEFRAFKGELGIFLTQQSHARLCEKSFCAAASTPWRKFRDCRCSPKLPAARANADFINAIRQWDRWLR